MEVNTVQQLITSVGFPIAVCIVCFWYIYQSQKQHKEEIDKMSEAINNNTLVMQKLVDKMGGDLNG